MKIVNVNKFNNYVQKETKKRVIVIHGTAGGTANGAIQFMKKYSGQNVSVHYVIDRDGTIYQLFDDKYYAHHAGSNFRQLSKYSIGIQLVN